MCFDIQNQRPLQLMPSALLGITDYFPMLPPLSLVSRVQAKVNRGKTDAVIVEPDWLTRYWYPQLKPMTTQSG